MNGCTKYAHRGVVRVRIYMVAWLFALTFGVSHFSGDELRANAAGANSNATGADSDQDNKSVAQNTSQNATKNKTSTQKAKPQKSKTSLGSHLHGAAKLFIALEGKTMTSQFIVDNESIMGFEYKPTTRARRETVRKVSTQLAQVSSLFELQKPKNCTSEVSEINTFHQSTQSSENHSETKVTYKFVCHDRISNVAIALKVFDTFSRVNTVQLTVLGESKQFGKTISKTESRAMRLVEFVQ